MSIVIAPTRVTMSGDSTTSRAVATVRSRARFAIGRASHPARACRAGASCRRMGTRMSVKYELVTRSPIGNERVHEYASGDPLNPGDALQLRGRFWLVERVEEPDGESGLPTAIAKPARYRLHLRHPDEREELGAVRRFRPGSPRLGHAFTTIDAGQPISWQVMAEELAYDETGEPFLDLIAERDYAEAEGDVPDHELEHAG